MALALAEPPHPRTFEGVLRRVGVEIEFAGIGPEAAARLVRKLYGGRIEQLDRHRFAVDETVLGRFVVELDNAYAHPKERDADDGRSLAGSIKGKLAEIQEKLAGAFGDVVSFWLPYEVAAPPIAYPRLSELDRLIATLRAHHAQGTADSLLYGFGLQLNPEVASFDADDLRRVLQAYLLLSPWLRAEIAVDPTRRILPFVDKFPRRYLDKVLTPAYRPDLPRLIDDYLQDNATRNRELDLLPLFAHVDPGRINRIATNTLIKGRPTFHYRLPNSRVDDPTWGGVVEEWNRWVKVERLAADEWRLNEALHAYQAYRAGEASEDWVEQSRRWVIP